MGHTESSNMVWMIFNLQVFKINGGTKYSRESGTAYQIYVVYAGTNSNKTGNIHTLVSVT